MKKILTSFSFMLVCLMCHSAYGQEQTITGEITSEDGTALPGVAVVVKGTSTGAVTDYNGNYILAVPASATTLVMSFIGYETAEIDINGRSIINYRMSPEITELSEVVVTAFGIEQEKRSLGYAVEDLDAQEITRTKQTNLVSALQGKISGVQITNSGGAPGMSARIIIRGLTSLDPNADNQPLFVVDGVPIDNTTMESPGTPRGLSNRAADINPNDIESISILKGAAATALYGVRAANGAVVITTKKGKAGKVSINLKSTIGFEEINKYPDFQEKYGQGFAGSHNPDDFWPSWGAPISAVQVIDPDHRFYDNTRNTMRTGRIYDSYLSVSGGSENATFLTSVSNYEHEGVIPFSNWGRTSAKISGTAKIADKFNMSGSVIYTNSGGDRVPHDRVFERLVYWSNTEDVTNYILPDGTMRSVGSNTNPIYDARFAKYEDDVNRIIGNVNLNYKPTDWFSIQYRLGSDYYSDQRTEILPGPLGIEGEAALSSTGFIEEMRTNSRDINSTLNFTFNRNFSEKFSGSLRIGHDVFDRSRNSVTSTGLDFVIPQFYNLGNVTTQLIDQNLRQQRLIGLYGDLTLNYSDYLYLNVTGRNDWSSTLPAENRSFFYPSVSTAFIFHDVFSLPEAVSFAKLRASYAQVGKDAQPYSTATTYGTAAGFPLNGQLGFSRNSILGSPDLKPERTTSIEFGLQANFIQNRLGFDVTWYKSNSKDQIIPVPVSNGTGFTRLITNAGELQNKGIEVLINATPVRTPDFTWDVSFNFSRNRNEVVDIREGIQSIVIGSQFGYVGSRVTSMLIEGDPYGNLYGSSYQRYYKEGTPEGLTSVDRDKPLLIGSDGFPVRNTDQLILGNSQPDWLAGLHNTFTYKNISLSFLIDVRRGIDQFDQFANFYAAFGKLDYSLDRNSVVVFNGVLEDGTQNTQQVWLGQGIGPDYRDYGAGYYRRNDFRGNSENFVQDASFIKLRNVTLSYKLPDFLFEKLPFESIDVSAAANNIIVTTPWKGYDPESFSSGASGNATAFTGLGYPGVQSYLFSLNITL